MLTTTLWRIVVVKRVINEILKLRLLLMDVNSQGGGNIYYVFQEEGGGSNSNTYITEIFMICL